jgi:hypothetical protein
MVQFSGVTSPLCGPLRGKLAMTMLYRFFVGNIANINTFKKSKSVVKL